MLEVDIVSLKCPIANSNQQHNSTQINQKVRKIIRTYLFRNANYKTMESLSAMCCVSPRLVGYLITHLSFRWMWQCSHPHGLNITGITAQKFQTLQDKPRISQGQGAYSRITNT